MLYDHASKSLDKIIKIQYDPKLKEFLCLFAHNFVEIYRFNDNSQDFEMVERKFCTEECILYAGDILKGD